MFGNFRLTNSKFPVELLDKIRRQGSCFRIYIISWFYKFICSFYIVVTVFLLFLYYTIYIENCQVIY